MDFLARIGLDGIAEATAHDASLAQAQSGAAFGFKWSRRETYESPAMQERTRAWLFDRYTGGHPQRLDAWLSGGRKIILDAGCGAGFSTLLFFGPRTQRACSTTPTTLSAHWIGRSRKFARRKFPPMPDSRKRALPCLAECPLISATEETVYDVLRDLLMDPARRAEIGRLSRAYALKWHAADACAERYEPIYDRLFEARP